MSQETVQGAPGCEEALLFDKQRSEPKFAVGLKVFLEMSLKNRTVRSTADTLGWQRPAFLMTSIPQVDNRIVIASPGVEVTVRYLLDGTVYGFNTHMVHKQSDPFPMWVLEYPSVVETKTLRRSPRISLSVPVTVADGRQFRTVDLSAHGALLAMTGPAALGQKLTLSFQLPDGTPIEGLEAEIVRLQESREETLAGVNFTDTAREQVDRIAGYLYGGATPLGNGKG